MTLEQKAAAFELVLVTTEYGTELQPENVVNDPEELASRKADYNQFDYELVPPPDLPPKLSLKEQANWLAIGVPIIRAAMEKAGFKDEHIRTTWDKDFFYYGLITPWPDNYTMEPILSVLDQINPDQIKTLRQYGWWLLWDGDESICFTYIL